MLCTFAEKDAESVYCVSAAETDCADTDKSSAAGTEAPATGAAVSVSISDENGLTLISESMTDRSGRTERLTIPTPPKAASLTPGNGTDDIKPFTTVVIEVSKNGFYTNQYINTLVFPDILTLQNVNMFPSPGNTVGMEDTVYFDNGGNEI